MKNLFVCGPCGSGKSTFSAWLAKEISYTHIEWDIVAPSLGISVNGRGLAKLIPYLSKIEKGFVLDFGGDAIFRPHQDNVVNLSNLQNLKKELRVKGLLLDVTKNVAFEQLQTSPEGLVRDFDAYWDRWINYARPYWASCVDHAIRRAKPFTENTTALLDNLLE